MSRTLTLTEPFRGFDAGTRFDRVATYDHWHISTAKLETVDGTGRIEVTADELLEFFAA